MSRRWLRLTTILAVSVLRVAGDVTAQTAAAVGERPSSATSSVAATAPAMILAPTNHPRLSRNASHLWLAPTSQPAPRSHSTLLDAISLLQKGSEAQAFAALTQSGTQDGVLGHYAMYYAARAQQRMSKPGDALRAFRALQMRPLVGYLREAAAIGEAETLEATGEHAEAADIYARLSKERPVTLDDVLLRLGREAEAAGHTERAIEAYLRVYYEFPLGGYASSAKARLDSYPNFPRIAAGTERFRLELGRAQRLFGAKQYAPARSAFEGLRASATGDDRAVVDLRIAAADFYLRRHRAAREGVAPYTTKGTRQAEALYFDAVASRALGDNARYLQNVRTIVEKFPAQSWAEEALNNLATQYVRQDADDAADTVFRELIQRYPRGTYTERAVWKVGWRSYRAGRLEEAAQLFERAAFDFPRSDYRPAWLFWSGRAHEASGKKRLAEARFTLTALDYLNSYYGRMAVGRLNGRVPPPRVIADVADPAVGASASVTVPPPNDAIVRALLEAGLYEDALNELAYIQRNWGDSAAVQATTSWIYRRQGLIAPGGWDQFTLLRGSITLMRRAYPQFMAAGGEQLPREVLAHIFPISYWDLIQKHAEANKLDPYLVAALVAQESTFVPDVRSSANAVGLMQLIPSTARMYARKLNLAYSSKLMSNPEANIRMGTAYLADKIAEFGETHLALASYNAGERAVRRWMSERPGVANDEFIDDIPYPETQNYVKRILGTADDYRRLYGDPGVAPTRLTSSTVDVVLPAGPGLRLVDADAVGQVTAVTPVKPESKKKSARSAKPTARKRSARTSSVGNSRTSRISASRLAAVRGAGTRAPRRPVVAPTRSRRSSRG